MSDTGDTKPSKLAGLIVEARRRKVFRIAAVYAAAAWVVLQLGDVLFEPLGLPDWSIMLVLAIVAAGFPVTVILAWVFDFTSDGVIRTRAAERAPAPLSKRRYVDFALIAFLSLAVGYLYMERFVADEAVSADPATPIAAPVAAGIAVLPFSNMSGDADNRYFADGVSEEILNELTRLRDVRVIARTSSFRFRGDDLDLRDVGNQLNVSHILEGSVRKVGNEVRITAQLIDTSDNAHLWSETYQRTLDDVFLVQGEVAADVAVSLSAVLEAPVEDTSSPWTPEGFDAYLAGVDLFNRTALLEAERQLELALTYNPDNADVLAYLARTKTLQPSYGLSSVAETHPVAERYAMKALELRPEDPIATASLIMIRFFQEKDFERAYRELRAAIDRHPNSEVAINWLRTLVTVTENWALCLEIADESLAVNPLRGETLRQRARFLYVLGREEDARASYRDAIAAGDQIAHEDLALYAARDGDSEAAKRHLDDLEASGWAFVAESRAVVATIGRWPGAEALSEAAIANANRPYVKVLLAAYHGRVDDAIRFYRESIEADDPSSFFTPFILKMPWNDNAGTRALRDHPSFIALTRSIGVDEASVAKLSFNN